MLNTKFNHDLGIDTQRLNALFAADATVLRYNQGPFGHWMLWQLCAFHNVAYECVVSFRISDANETWALVVIPNITVLPFKDEPLLP